MVWNASTSAGVFLCGKGEQKIYNDDIEKVCIIKCAKGGIKI